VLPVANYSLELRISGATPAAEEQTEEVWISFAKMEFQVEIIRRDSWLVGMGLKRRQYTQPFLSMQVVFTAG